MTSLEGRRVAPFLATKDLDAGFGTNLVLHGVDLAVNAGRPSACSG